MFKGKLKNDSTLVIFVWTIFLIFNILMCSILNTMHDLPDKYKYEDNFQNLLPTYHDSLYEFIVFDILTFLLLLFITIGWKVRKNK